ncbi:MAG: Ig-like domain-containing protein [Propionibacteriaceae bacterium]|nr:Ig-like domain-containing protein [Propionibacteriaceae bacterium]
MALSVSAAMALAMVSLSTLGSGLASDLLATANAAPGTPGVPQDPTPVFSETFGTAGTVSTPMSLRDYPSPSAPLYTADTNWWPPVGTDTTGNTGCNGWILNSTTPIPPDSRDTTCKKSSMWDLQQHMALVLGQAQGMSNPAANNVLTASTNRYDLTQVAGYMLRANNLVTVQGDRFYGVSAYFAAVNCYAMSPQNNYKDPSERFDLMVDGTPTTLATGLNPCTSGTLVGSGWNAVRWARLDSGAMLLPAGSHNLGMQLYQATASGVGNDVAFDTPSIVDMTPQLDQAFSPSLVPVGGSSVLTFTITNTTDLQAKPGWSFSEPMPTGLTLSGTPSTTCAGGAVSTSGGTVLASGNLNRGQASCTVTVPVTVTTAGSYTLSPSYVTVHALSLPGSATISTTELQLSATASPTSVTTAGTTVQYTFTVTNPDPVTVSGLTVSMAGPYVGPTAEGFSGTGTLSAITCNATTLPANGSTTCHASYTVTQQDIDNGGVTGTAIASATATGATMPTKSNFASVDVPAGQAGALHLTYADPGTMSDPGDVLHYSFTLANTGNTTITTAHITTSNFTGSGTPPTITCTPTSIAPNASATCTGDYVITDADILAGSVVLTAVGAGTDGGGTVTSNSVTVTVDYTPGPPNPSHSTLTVDHTSQTVGQPVVATVTARDSHDVPLGGVVASLSLDGSATFGTATAPRQATATCTTAPVTGQCQVTLTDTVAETIHVTATVPVAGVPTQISGSPATVEFTQDIVNAQQSTLELDRHTQTVGDPVVATVTTLDQYGNPVPGVTATLGLTSHGTFAAVGQPVLSTTTCVTAGPTASCSVELTDTRVETIQVSASVPVGGVPTPVGGAGDPTKASPQSVAFTHGEPDPNPPPCEDPTVRFGTNLSVDPLTLPVGETSSASALITDRFCNPVPDVPVTFTIDSGTNGVLTVTQGTTDASGMAYATLTDTKAEVVTLHASITEGEIHGSPQDVTFTHGDVSAQQSTLELNRHSQTAGDPVVATVTTLDEYGNPVPGVTVTLGLTGYGTFAAVGQPILNTTTCVTAGPTATCSVELTDVYVETIQVSASVPIAGVPTPVGGGGDPTKASPQSVEFTPGPPDPTPPPCVDPVVRYGTNLSVDPSTLSVGDTSFATALITDRFCNPVPNVPVTFTIDSGTNGILTVTQGTTDANGLAYATLTDTTAEVVTLHASITQGEINGSPQDVTFTAGDLCVSCSSFSVYMTDTTATQVVADGVQSWTGKLVARDAQYNLLPNLLTSDMNFGATPPGVTVSAVSNDGNGVYTVTYTTTTAGTYDASVRYKGTQVGTNEPITFVAGLPDPGHSDVAVDPNVQVINSYVTITVTVRDRYDNPVTGLPQSQVVVTGQDVGPTGLPNLTLSNFLETSPGVYTYDATSAEVGEFEVSAVVEGVQLTQRPHVKFTNDLPDLRYSNVEVQPNYQQVDLMVTITVTVRDASDAPIAGLPESQVVVTGQSVDPVGLPNLTLSNFQEISPGVYTYDATSAKAGEFEVSAVVEGVQLTQRPHVTFHAGPPDPGNSNLTVSPPTQEIDHTVTITATVRDQEDNPVTGLPQSQVVVTGQSVSPTGLPNLTLSNFQEIAPGVYTYDATSAKVGEFEVSAVVAGVQLTQRPHVTFYFGPPDPGHSNVTVQPTYQVINDMVKVTVTVRDVEDNPVTGLPQSQVVVTGQSVSPTGLPNLTLSNFQETSPGVYTYDATSAQVGEFEVSAVVEGVQLTQRPHVTFTQDLPDTRYSNVEVQPNYQEVDLMVTITVTVRDASDAPIAGLPESQVVVTGQSVDPVGLPNLTLSNFQETSPGVYTYDATSAKAGEFEVSAVVEGVQLTQRPHVTFHAGPPNPGNSNLTVQPTVQVINDMVKITATVRDQEDNPVTGLPQSQVVVTGQDVGPTGLPNLTLSNFQETSPGVYTYDATSPVPGEFEVSAVVAGVPLTQRPHVTFHQDLPNVDHSNVTVDPPTQVVGDLVTITVTVRNGSDVPITGLPESQVVVTGQSVSPTGLPNLTLSNFQEITPGVYTYDATSLKIGEFEVSAVVEGVQLTQRPHVTFTHGPFDPGNSTLSLDPPTQTVGALVTITGVAHDQYDNPITGLTSAQLVVSGVSVAPTGLPDLTITNFLESAPGVYTYSATSKLVGEFEVSGAVDGVAFLQHPHVTFVHGGVCVSNCEPVDPTHLTRFEMVDNDRMANGQAQDTAKAWAYDHYGNVVPGATVLVIDQSTGELTGYLTPRTQTTTTGADGTAMVAWTSTKAGTFTAEGTIDSLRPVTGVMNQIRFTNGAADPAMSEMVITPASPITVGDGYTVTVTAKDTTGNIVPDATFSFYLDPASPASLSATSCQTNPDGVCTVTVSSLLVTTVSVHATLPKNGVPTDVGGGGDRTKASPQTVSFKAGPVCVVNCNPVNPDNVTRVEVTVDGVEANGSASDTAMAYAYDKYGNPVQGAAVTSTTTDSALTIVTPIPATAADGTSEIQYRSTVAAAHVASVRIDGLVPVTSRSMDGRVTTDGTITLNFGSGTVANATLSISPTTSQVVGSLFTVTATMKDASGNPVSGAVAAFPPVADLTFSAASCTTGADGTCTVTVTSKLVGTYTVSALQGGLPFRNTVDAVFTHGPVCTQNCEPVDTTHITRVEVTQDGREADGVAQDIAKVWAYDRYGNAVPGAVVASTPVAGETALTIQPDIAVTDADGISTIWYTSTVMGTHHADVTVDTQIPQGSPVAVSFGNGNGDPGHSGWVITPAGPLTVGQGTANTYTATATIHDKTDNPVQNAVVSFAINPTGPTWVTQNSCITNASGICSVQVWSTKSGTYAVTASIVAGAINNTTTGQPAASVAWKADQVCSQLEGCQPVDPNLPAELRTRVEVTTDNATANLVDRDVATVWAFDKWGNAVEGALVQSTTTDAKLNIQTGIDPISADGTSTIWYTSMVAGAHIASVTADGFRPVGDPITLNFVAGPVCVTEADCVIPPDSPSYDNKDLQTHVTVTKDNQPVTGDPDQVTGYAFDKYGNVVAGVDFNFAKVISTDDLVIDPVCTTNAQGTCVVNGRAMKEGAHQATASVNGTELVDHGSPVTLNFQHGDVCVKEAGCDIPPDSPSYNDVTLQTHVAVTTNDQKIGDSDVITGYAFDMYGNPVPDTTFDIATADQKLELAGTKTFIPTSPLKVGPNGTNTMPATSYVVGSHVARASVNGTELTDHGSPMDLRFTGGPAAPVITDPVNNTTTNDPKLPISGTGDNPGDTVTVADQTSDVCTAVVQANKTWTCTPDQPLKDGDHTLVAHETDVNGNTSGPSNEVKVTIDTVKPNPPVPDPSNGSEVSGTTDKDTTVTVRDDQGQPIKGCIDIVPDSQGVFMCKPDTRIPAGETVTLVAKDEAGNVSDPAPLVISALTLELAYPTRNPLENQVATGYNFNPNERVHFVLGTVDLGYATADPKGTVTLSFAVPANTPNGTQTLTATGDTSGPVQASFMVTVETQGQVTPTPEPSIKTGGTVDGSGSLRGLAACLLVAGAVIGVGAGLRRKDRELIS